MPTIDWFSFWIGAVSGAVIGIIWTAVLTKTDASDWGEDEHANGYNMGKDDEKGNH